MPNLPDRSLNVTMTLSVNDEHIGSQMLKGALSVRLGNLRKIQFV